MPLIGAVLPSGDPWMPWRVVDELGEVIEPVAAYLADLQARDRAAATLRSYGMDLLRWWRFLAAVDVTWGRAARSEARDFMRWMLLAPKRDERLGDRVRGVPNPITGKPSRASTYAAATRAHAETVLRQFYDFHLEVGTGPVINPFPKVRGHRDGRPNAHWNPMEVPRSERVGLYRPKVATRIPRSIPDELFNALFAALPSHRDRALVAFYVSSGARASELLGALEHDADPGQQLITVVRKGSRARQPLPASPDAFVWLRLYQEELRGLIPPGPSEPLWWTRRSPLRPLAYHAAYQMFRRANALLGSNWSLHDLRHTAAHRLAADREMPITDVQWVLGHAHLSTTELYLTPRADEVIAHVQEHWARRSAEADRSAVVVPAPGYRPESLDVLFARSGS